MIGPFYATIPPEVDLSGYSVNELLLFVGDEDKGCKPEAMDRLLSMGLEPNLPLLESAVRNDSDADLRNGAMEVLVRFGQQAVSPLLVMLRDENEEVRNFAAVMLGNIASRDAVYPLIKSLQDPDNNVRHAAAEALGKIADHAALIPLMELLKEDFWQQFPAITAMGELRDRRAVSSLLPLLENDMLREVVVEALGKIGDSRAIPPLVRLINDPSANVAVAAKALEAILRQDAGNGSAGKGSGSGSGTVAVPMEEQGIINLRALLAAGTDRETHCAAIFLLGWLRHEPAIADFFPFLEHGGYEEAIEEAVMAIGKPAVPLLLRFLSGLPETTAVVAIRLLRRLGKRIGAEQLLLFLQSGSDAVRHEALVSLCGMTDPTILPTVSSLLENGSPDLIDKAMKVVSRFPPDLIQPVAANLCSSPDPMRRAAAATLMGYARAEVFTGAFLNLFSDSSAFVRREAARAARNWQIPAVVPLLLSALEDEDFAVQRESVITLMQSGLTEAVADVLKLLGKKDERLDYEIIKGVVRTEFRSVESSLVDYLAKPDLSKNLAFAVIETLGLLQVKGGAGHRQVQKFLAHPDPDIRRSACKALASLAGLESLEELAVACRDSHWSVRVAALIELGRLGGDKAIPTLSAALNDRDILVRKNAMMALGRVRSPQVVEVLLKHLLDPEAGRYAAEALVCVGRTALARLHRILEQEGRTEVKERVIEVIAGIGDNRSIVPLMAVLSDDSPSLRLSAAEALLLCHKNLSPEKRGQVEKQISAALAAAVRIAETPC